VLLYGSCVVYGPLLCAELRLLGRREAGAAMLLVLAGVALLLARLGPHFSPPQLVALRAAVPKTRLYRLSVAFAWLWVSLPAIAEFALVSTLGLVSRTSAALLELLAQAVVLAQLLSFASLKPSPRLLSVGCLAVCSHRMLSAPFLTAAAAAFVTLPRPCVLLLLTAPFFLTLLGLRATLPPLKGWEHVAFNAPAPQPLPVAPKHRVVARAPFHSQPLSTSAPGSVLRVVQITDTHLGCVTTAADIRAFCQDIVDTVDPDLVLLTGDMLTTECYSNVRQTLVFALEPLRRLKSGHVFACLGNQFVTLPSPRSDFH